MSAENTKKLKEESAYFQIKDKFFLYEKKSLGVFSENNWLRLKAVHLIKNRYYETALNFSVCLASVTIGFKDYSKETDDSSWNFYVVLMNFFFTLVFFLDTALKILVQGFIEHKNAYLKDGFNIIDFVLVFVG